MKKLFLLIVSFVYFGISTGVTLQVHYCMGKLVNVGLVNKSDSHCDLCGMAKKNGHKGCCHDEQKTVKITQDQNRSTEPVYQVVHAPVAMVETNYPDAAMTARFSSEEKILYFHEPPQVSGLAVYIRNCVFRI